MQQAGGDAATQEAVPVADDSDDEMGRELFGNGDAGAYEDAPTATAAVPAAAPSAQRLEPPAPAVSVRQLTDVRALSKSYSLMTGWRQWLT